MKAKIEDRRSELEKTTHTELVVGLDEAMTRMGRDCGTVGKTGRSIAAWACRPADADRVMAWVQARGDMKRVRRVKPGIELRTYRGDHLSIYCVRDGHPAIEEGQR